MSFSRAIPWIRYILFKENKLQLLGSSSKLISERVCKQCNFLRFFCFFRIFELFSVFLLVVYSEVLFNFFQIMDFWTLLAFFEAFSSTFRWFFHVLFGLSQDFLCFGLAVFGNIAIIVRWLHIGRKEGMVDNMGNLLNLRRLVFLF